jgi:hypothetical protein
MARYVESADNEQIVVVAGGTPHTLAVSVPRYVGAFEPEFPLSCHHRALLARADYLSGARPAVDYTLVTCWRGRIPGTVLLLT